MMPEEALLGELKVELARLSVSEFQVCVLMLEPEDVRLIEYWMSFGLKIPNLGVWYLQAYFEASNVKDLLVWEADEATLAALEKLLTGLKMSPSLKGTP